MWGAGIAGATAAVAGWSVVGRGFFLLAGAVAALLGVGAWLGELGFLALAGSVLIAAGAAVLDGRRATVTVAVGAASLGAAAGLDALLPTVTGALALGGVTGEMLLGHWYLVDPTLPRWPLQRLALAGIVGFIADLVLLSGIGLWSAANGLAIVAVVVLSVTSVVLMVGVWFSLREPSYTGVMAATGLSYLAVLTGLGAVVVGRAVTVDGGFLLSTISG